MKNILLSLILLCSGLLVSGALGGQTPLVYSISGKVKYAASAEGKLQKLKTGTELAPEGVLKIYPGARIALYDDDQFAIVSTAGQQSVRDIAGNTALFRESELAEVFDANLQKALDPYYFYVVNERSGFGGGSNNPPPPPPPKPTKDGHGDKKHKVVRIQPIGGKVAAGTVTFRWELAEADNKVKDFIFSLTTPAEEVLFETKVKGYSFELTPADYRLEPGKIYRWKASVSGQEEEMSTAGVIFEVAEAAQRQQQLKRWLEDEMYATAGPAAQLLLRAVSLEQEGFTSEAFETFETAARQYRKDPLVQIFYQYFLYTKDLVK